MAQAFRYTEGTIDEMTEIEFELALDREGDTCKCGHVIEAHDSDGCALCTCEEECLG